MSMGIGERLKFALWRGVTPLIIGWKWRGKKARNLSVRGETMPVKGGTIRLRIYTPQGQGPFPLLLYFHGGGWVFGDLETHDPVCRDLCVRARRIVVSVDYRLAPEHAFPIPVEDCIASLAWTWENALRLGGDPHAIVIVGDSAGGNLAAVVAQQARQLFPGLLKGQVLVYPVTDHCAHAQRESYTRYGGEKYGLTTDSMAELWAYYLRDSALWQAGMKSHDLATPLHVRDLAGLPRTLFVLAEEDMLCDEGTAYAKRLSESGIPTQVEIYPRQRHGFFGLEPTGPYKKAIADIAAWLNAG